MSNPLIDALRAPSAGREGEVFLVNTGLTYGAFWDGVERLASTLAVTPGARVAVQTEKSLTALQLYLSTLWAGGVYLPLNPAYTPGEVAYFLGDAEPEVFVCDPSVEVALRPLAGAARVLTLGADGTGSLTGTAPRPFAPPQRGTDDLAAILYTSGTTGRSKGAMLSQGNLLSNARVLVEVWRFTDADTLIHALPIFHTHGLFVATNVALLSGARLIFQPRFDAGAVLAALPQATALMGVPTFYTRLLAHPGLTRDGCAAMRLFISGSAPLLADTHEAFEARTGHAILERYGMTEASMITSAPYDGPRRAGTVGRALPGIDLRIAGPDGTPLPPGEIGGIEIRGPNVFQGYWRMPERTAQEFRADGFFITGDLGRMDPGGTVTVVGRSKDLIISGGLNIYPKEVEEAIDALPGVVESAVIGLPHPDLGEAVAAVMVGRASEADILAALSGHLARFKQPRAVFLVADLPRNAMGKVQKAALRTTYAATFRP